MRYYTRGTQSQASAQSHIAVFVTINDLNSLVWHRREHSSASPYPPQPFPVPLQWGRRCDWFCCGDENSGKESLLDGGRHTPRGILHALLFPLVTSVKATGWFNGQSHRHEAVWTTESWHGVALESCSTFRGLCKREKWTSWAKPLRFRDGHLSTLEGLKPSEATKLTLCLHLYRPSQWDLLRLDSILLY